MKKANVTEIGESDEEEMERVKWKDFKVHQLIAIRGEMEEEFVRSSNKQSKFKKKIHFFGQTMKTLKTLKVFNVLNTLYDAV